MVGKAQLLQITQTSVSDQHAQYKDSETKAAKWKSSINNII